MTTTVRTHVFLGKGGVGKTTLATNLAIYLKAMREDLPANVVPEAAQRRKDVDYIEISRHDWMEWKPVGDLINAARQRSGK